MAGIVKIGSEAKAKNDDVLQTFQNLRREQQIIITKISDLEAEENELKVVINTLEQVDGNKKCYRLIGGVLCQKTVKDVLPILKEKKEEITKSLMGKLREELSKKGSELNEFKEKHNLKFPGQNGSNGSPAGDTNSKTPSAGVLSK